MSTDVYGNKFHIYVSENYPTVDWGRAESASMALTKAQAIKLIGELQAFVNKQEQTIS